MPGWYLKLSQTISNTLFIYKSTIGGSGKHVDSATLTEDLFNGREDRPYTFRDF
jgi:hypothetical protein